MTRLVWTLCTAYTLSSLAAAVAAPPAKYRRKKPKSAMELLSQDAEPVPASAPAAQRAGDDPTPQTRPFGRQQSRPAYALPGVVVYSDGRKVPGYIWTPSGKEWRVYERASKQFRDIPFDVIKRIDGLVEWERMEDDWRWREGGMDVKVYTGKKYPNRMTYFSFVLLDDRKIVGNIAQMFFVELGGRISRITLHKRQQGRLGQTLASMPYVKTVLFDAKAMKQAIEEITASQPASRPAGRPGTRPAKR